MDAEKPMDKLVHGDTVDGLVILNYGDPSYKAPRDKTAGLSRPEEIFLRLIAYLTFAEAASVPARHILEGDEMAQAMAWAAPLLEEGILLPERRVEATSFDELAHMRSLPEIGLRRAEFLDRHSARVRHLVWTELAEAYRELLDRDLGPDGAFRRTVVGGSTGKLAAPLNSAHVDHVANGDGTPEGFVRSVAKFVPSLGKPARRWAMARYYTTPLMFDSANTREIPSSAADLLIKGRVLDPALRPFERAAPADAAFHRLQAAIPARSIETDFRQYCEALLEVRRELPEARRIFADISQQAHLKDAGESLSALFEKELARQQRIKPSKNRVFTLISSLLGGAAGGAAGLAAGSDLAAGFQIGVMASVVTGAASNEAQGKMQSRKDRKKRPWLLAMDRLDQRVTEE